VSSPQPRDPWPAARIAPERGFAEPDADDDDTGPLHIATPAPSEDSTSASGLGEEVWWRRFEEPLTISPRPARRDRKPSYCSSSLPSWPLSRYRRPGLLAVTLVAHNTECEHRSNDVGEPVAFAGYRCPRTAAAHVSPRLSLRFM